MAVTIKSAISSVKWDNFGEHMLKIFTGIYENLQYTDCELILIDGQVRANRMVLGMASSFFENIFAATKCQPVTVTEPLIVLIPDLSVSSMQHVLQFIYTGEVKLCPQDMSTFLDACYLLHIRGLKSNEGRVQGASICDTNPETHGTVAPEVTPPTTDSSTYLMSLVHTVPDESSVVPEAKQDKSLGATIGQLVLQTTALGDVGVEFIATSKVPAAQEACGVPYFDSTEDDQMGEDPAHHQNDADTDSFDGLANLPCIDSFMADEMEEMNSSNVDKELSTENKSASYAERLEMAVNAVVNDGTSFRTASITYDIPKTVLWRKTVKISRPIKPQQHELPSGRREAMEAIKAGEKLIHVSRRFDIPISTLHRDKIRLYSQGGLPDTVALKQRNKGDKFQQRLVEAAQKCLAGVMTLSAAARFYSLPKTTIWRKIGSLKDKPECSSSGSLKRVRTKPGSKPSCNEQEEIRGTEVATVVFTKRPVIGATGDTTKMRMEHIPSNYVFM